MERLEAALRMDVEGGAENDEVSKGEEEGDGTLRSLGSLEFLTQDA